MEFTRILPIPKSSFLLLGPRGTGKSTIIRTQLPTHLEIDLLKSKVFLPLSANPSLLADWTAKVPAGGWVFVDEIQKIPALLDEVQSIYEERKIHFALSGSSARKLRRTGANLLAGRALSKKLFTLTYGEYNQHCPIDDAIDWGTLPKTILAPNDRADFLSTYVETYLREELVEESLIRKIEPFSRFLNLSGQYNGQILNIENIARESHLGRSTITKYFEILEETLIGQRLECLQAGYNKKELTHPKFYLFDSGVARACANLAHDEIDSVWRGFAFETLVLNEIRAMNHYLKKNRPLFYYKYSGGYEIDIVIENTAKTMQRKRSLTAIEIKNTTRWDKRWNDPLIEFQNRSKGEVQRILGIYRGKEILNYGSLKILPVETFFQNLANTKLGYL
jgi:predicted AAA+ superfamily ATPase